MCLCCPRRSVPVGPPPRVLAFLSRVVDGLALVGVVRRVWSGFSLLAVLGRPPTCLRRRGVSLLPPPIVLARLFRLFPVAPPGSGVPLAVLVLWLTVGRLVLRLCVAWSVMVPTLSAALGSFASWSGCYLPWVV